MDSNPSANLRELASERRFDEAVYTYIRQTDYVSIPQLKRVFSSLIEVDGENAIPVSGCRNLVYWVGLSDQLAAILGRLARHGLIRYEETTPLTYLAEGHIPNLPIAPKARSYKALHWLPAVLRGVSIPSASASASAVEVEASPPARLRQGRLRQNG